MSPDGSKTGNMTRNYHFAVSSKTKNPDLAWKMVQWLNHGPEFRMQKFQTETFGFVPSVKNYPMPSIYPEQIKTAFTESMKATLSSSVSRCHSNGILADELLVPSGCTQST